MSETCHRSGMKVYAADNPVRIGGMVFHPSHFTCKATGVKLSLKTAVIATDPATGEKDMYLRGKEPWIKPNQVEDVITQRVAAVPDANMRTSDRMFNTAGKQQSRGTGGDDLGSSYGAGAQVIETQVHAPKPPMTVDNINQTEKRHNGAEYTNASDEAPAE
jgi:uncharacterized Fe-S cluster protein YjdI